MHLLPIDDKKKTFLLWFCVIEFITAAENVQTSASDAEYVSNIVSVKMVKPVVVNKKQNQAAGSLRSITLPNLI